VNTASQHRKPAPTLITATEHYTAKSTWNRNAFASLAAVAALLLSGVLTGCNLFKSSSSSSAATGTVTEYAVPTADSSPSGIVAGPDGNLWFLEAGANSTAVNKVAKITTTGGITEYTLPTVGAFPTYIINGPDGNLWYVDEAHTLGQVTTSGVVTSFTATNPGGLTVGPDNNLWMLEFNGDTVDVFNTSGAMMTSYGSNFSPANLQGEAIITGPDGNLWFNTFSGDNVVKMSSGGAAVGYVYTSQVTGVLRQMANGPDGNVWIADQGDNLIARVTPSGTMTAFPLPTSNAEPYGITAGPDGNLWFTEINANQIGRITTSGTITEYPVTTTNSAPYLITAGPDGNLWFTEQSGNNIGMITP
jgi:streptogramin lyase